MNIGLFFGSFNPIHSGHLTIAEYFVKNELVSEVWFVVSPQSPFKQDFIEKNESVNRNTDFSKLMLDFEERVSLIKEAIKLNPKLKVCTIEQTLPKPSYTIDTLNELAKKYPSEKFIILMGSDQLKGLEKWKNWDEIASTYKIFVYPRGYEDFAYIKPNTIVFANAPLIDISSTKIRNQWAK
ncbi:MAG: nicotinate (nicotinamide) nucleotide adenylyltransferase [Bacteroidales bacterium]|jgi:nicotinate-nucleotide adenylyltransferase